jgi:hypothetical protein
MRKEFLAALLLPIPFLLSIQHLPFFWDTVQLASKHAHFFYENGLKWAVLPSEIDSGHPPLLGYCLAVAWSVLGQTLPVSHWLLYPAMAGIIYQLLRLGHHLNAQWAWWLLPIVLLDPVLLGQAALVSPDLVVLLGILCVMNGFFGQKNALIAIGGVLLCLFSMRGMMCAAALGLWLFGMAGGPFLHRAKAVLPLMPGALVGFAFLWWHHRAAGWTGHYEGSTWAGAFERVGPGGMVRNVAILGWRWFDLGRVAVWVVLLWRLYRMGWRDFYAQNRTLVWLLGVLVIFLSPSAILYQNLSAHRYFLPIFAALGILAWAALARGETALDTKKSTTGAYVFCSVMLALGHFWVYPRGVSMDWDCTLAHLPYHRLRAEAMADLASKGVDVASVGTSFPCLNTGENLMLNGDQRTMQPIDFDKNDYVLTSNVLNDVDEPEYAILQGQGWQLERRWGGWPVWFELYKKCR